MFYSSCANQKKTIDCPDDRDDKPSFAPGNRLLHTEIFGGNPSRVCPRISDHNDSSQSPQVGRQPSIDRKP